MEKRKKCSFLQSRSSSRNQRESSVGEAKTFVTQSKASVGNASISQAINGETSIEWVGSKDRSSCNSRGGSLFGSQTSRAASSKASWKAALAAATSSASS